jgi:hypothetical protein
MDIHILDYVWISNIVIAHVLLFIRIFIVAAHDQNIKLRNLFIDIGYEHRRLKEIAKQQSSKNKRIVFTAINILIPFLFISAFFIMIISIKFFHPPGLFLKT